MHEIKNNGFCRSRQLNSRSNGRKKKEKYAMIQKSVNACSVKNTLRSKYLFKVHWSLQWLTANLLLTYNSKHHWLQNKMHSYKCKSAYWQTIIFHTSDDTHKTTQLWREETKGSVQHIQKHQLSNDSPKVSRHKYIFIKTHTHTHTH